MVRNRVQVLLALNMKRLRALHGMTGDELAEKADLSGTYIRCLETCRVWASAKTLDRLARALKVPVHELFLPRRK